jgi:hypothetical protein
MRNLIDRFWLPISGSVTSISFKGIENAASMDTPLLQVQLFQEHSLWYYLLIGVMGALGGLMVKIAWSCLKRSFPRYLKNLDQ